MVFPFSQEEVPSLCSTATFVLDLSCIFFLINRKKGFGECVPYLLILCVIYHFILAFIEKFHFLVTQHTQSVIKKVFAEEDEKHIEFFQRHFIEDFSLTNFLTSREDIIEAVTTKNERVG